MQRIMPSQNEAQLTCNLTEQGTNPKLKGEERMIIKYNRRALCMGDDAYNRIYRIEMPDDAALEDLIAVLLRGGNGNDWPIPQTSVIGWTIYSDVGVLADVSADKKRLRFRFPKETRLSALGLRWVFGARSDESPDASELDRLFSC